MPAWTAQRLPFPESREQYGSSGRSRGCGPVSGYAAEENLEAVTVATVTESPRLVMNWRGKTIVDISRAFLDTNGAHQEADVTLEVPGQ